MTKTEESPKNHLSLFSAIASGAALVLSVVALIVALCGGHDDRHEGHHYKMNPHYEMRGGPHGSMQGGPRGDMHGMPEKSPEMRQPDFEGQP